MSTGSQHHISLNGVGYRLAESVGDHYQRSKQPLRPPNSVVVQGEGRQDLFQVRPDVLLWSLTDWSGGEGQYKYNAQEADRHAILYNVDPFIRPGTLRPGPGFTTLKRDASVDPLEPDVAQPLTFGPKNASNNGELWGFAMDSATLVTVSRSTFATGSDFALTGPSSSGVVRNGVVADDNLVYILDDAGQIYEISSAGTATAVLSSAIGATDAAAASLFEVGDYLYLVIMAGTTGYKVHEISKSASFPIALPTAMDSEIAADMNDEVGMSFQAVAGPNRLYVMLVRDNNRTELREIIPTTASATGFGQELAVLPGFSGTSIWYHNGIIYMSGWSPGPQENERILLYLIPGGDFGTLGKVRPPYLEDFDSRVWGQALGVDLLSSYFTTWGTGEDPRVWQLDSVNGGFAQIGSFPDQTGEEIMPPVLWNGRLFVSTNGATSEQVYVSNPDTFTLETSYAVSPWHDFGLSDEKLLSSIVISHEALPADWEIKVYYAKDGSSTFTLAGTASTDNSTGERIAVSSGGSSVSFRTLRLKVEFNYTGAATEPTSTGPILNSVEVRSQVAAHTNVWALKLDLMDDLAASSERRTGKQKRDNLITIGETGDVVTLVDGYGSRKPADETSHDVVVDAYDIIMGRNGEGYAQVVLRETA